MKYTILTKKIDELDISDFDEEVLDQYKNFSVTPESVSYTVDGKKVMGTKESLLQDMCNKQIELIFDSFAERVAKKMHETDRVAQKMHETVEPSQNCVKCKHYCETEDENGVQSHCFPRCALTEQVKKLRKAAEETEDNEVRKGILKAIKVLEGDKEDLSDYSTNYVEGLVLQEFANAPTWTFHLKDRTSEKIKKAYQIYKMIVGDKQHVTLRHPLIKHTAERIGFENVRSNPYMPYDQTNQEGELLVIEERYGKVVFRVLDIPKEVLEED